jgi:hypothetical protein
MAKPLDDLRRLVAQGAGLVINQQQYTDTDLTALRAVVQASKGTLLFSSTHVRAVQEAGRDAKAFRDLCRQAREGKVLTIDVSDPGQYPSADLLRLVALAKEWGSQLYLLNAHRRDPSDLSRIAAEGERWVTFDLWH